MSTPSWSLRRVHVVDEATIAGLVDVLIDCVEGGASVSFMHPLSRPRASAFWRRAAEGVAAGERALEALAHLCFACVEMLTARTPGKSRRVADLTRLFASYLAEKYTEPAVGRPDYQGGLPICQLRKVEDFVCNHLAEEISIEVLAELVELSPFHFSRVFKQATGTTPLQFVTRERVTRAQQFIRETSRSLIEIALDVGYSSPSHFARVFRRATGVKPTEFRNAL